MKYIKVDEYTLEDAAREAARMNIPSQVEAHGIRLDVSREPHITEDSVFCTTPRSARAYLKQVREIRSCFHEIDWLGLKPLDGCLIYAQLDRAKSIANELARCNAGLEIEENIAWNKSQL